MIQYVVTRHIVLQPISSVKLPSGHCPLILLAALCPSDLPLFSQFQEDHQVVDKIISQDQERNGFYFYTKLGQPSATGD